MLIHGINKHLYFAPDDPEGSGSGGGGVGAPPAPDPVADPPAAKTFTEADVNQREAKLRRRYDREIKELKAAAEKTNALLEELRSGQNPGPKDPTPDPSDLAGRMELMEKRHERALEELRQQRDSEKAAREEERGKRLDVEKDRLLHDAISAAGVSDKNKVIALRYFAPCIVWDKLDEQWMYKLKSQTLVPIMDGVAEELPDNLKPSRLKAGGAGSSTGVPASRQRAQKDLEIAEAKLNELKQKAMKNGSRGQHMTAFRRHKAVVERMRMALKTQK